MNRQEQYSGRLAKKLPEYAIAAERTYYWSMKSDQEATVMKQTTAYVIAPVLFAYIEWVLADAVHRGLKRLYFLSRDGYQMVKIARIIQRKRRYKLELHYLYCSRYALQIPTNHLRDDFVEGCCTGGKALQLGQVLQRGGLTNEEVDFVLQNTDELGPKEQLLSYQHVRKLKDILNQNVYFKQLVLQHSKAAYDTCIGYLRQEGLFDEQPYAVVDSGWTGRMQAMLQRLLLSANQTQTIHGYYFGLYELPPDGRSEQYHPFYFKVKGNINRKVCFNNNVFEVIYSAPEGMTVGYQQDGERFLPVHKEKVLDTFFYEEQWRLIRRFTEEISTDNLPLHNPMKIRKRLSGGIAPVLKEFMSNPTVEEAQYYGSMRFSDHVLEEGKIQLAEPLGRRELRANHLLSRFRRMRDGKYVPTSFWLMGSLKQYRAGSLEMNWHRRQILLYYYALYIKKDLIRKT